MVSTVIGQYQKEKGKSLRPNFSPNKKRIITNLRKTMKAIFKNFSRANRKINRLQSSLNDCKNKMKELSDLKISQILENSAIPKCQSVLILEIFAAARLKNPKNRKYRENWMLVCLLFQIRCKS